MASLIVLLVMIVMTALTLWLALTNPISDCGCFGDALVLTNWQTFWKNIILLAAAIVVWKWPLEMTRIISESNQWIVLNYSALFILLFISGRSLYTLPQFDFRPYHIGADLKQGWQKMTEGEDSPYADFFIERIDDGEDITEQVLNHQGYMFLLVSPHLEHADDSQLDEINRIYEYSIDNAYPFYCLTASPEKAIEHWCDKTGAEYPFCLTDETVLKTVIRSNPGLLLLKDGTVIGKWSHNALPEEEEMTGRLEECTLGQQPKNNVAGKILWVFTWFVLPLFLLTVADRLWAWSRWLRSGRKRSAKKSEEETDNNNPLNKQ